MKNMQAFRTSELPNFRCLNCTVVNYKVAWSYYTRPAEIWTRFAESYTQLAESCSAVVNWLIARLR